MVSVVVERVIERNVSAHAHRIERVALIVAGDSLTAGESEALGILVADALAGGCVSVDIDLGSVTIMDAYAAVALLRMRSRVHAAGGRLRAIGASAAILNVLTAADPTDLLSAQHDRTSGPPRPAAVCCGITTVTRDDPIHELLRMANALPADDPRRAALRSQAIEMALPAAARLAKRFAGRGEPIDDLVQVAAIGLIAAIDRFDPEEPAGFWPYATPTILGELRKHFRDKGWGVRVPRRLQDVWLQIRNDSDNLAQRLGRSVTTHDLAVDLDLTEALIVKARLAGRSYRPASLSAPVLDGSVLEDYVATIEHGYAAVDDRLTVRRALLSLPRRARHILGLRFHHEMTQAQIAAAVGLSQMHVSRILTEAIAVLHQVIAVDALPEVQPAKVGSPGRSGSTALPSHTRISPTTKP
jgi:RNA polymerase sigma-B factor